MADGYVLSEKDRDLLKRKLNSQHPWPNIHGETEPERGQAQDVFVAKVQTDPGTILARKDDADNGFWEPGSAMCDLYQIVPGDSTHQWNLIQMNMAVPVFNVSNVNISDDWLVVVMDKTGHWIACNPTPATFERVRLNGNLYACESTTATILTPDLSASDLASGGDAGKQDCSCGKFIEGATITVVDRLAIVGSSLLGLLDPATGTVYIPAKTMAYVHLFADTGEYETIAFGEAVCSNPSNASDSEGSNGSNGSNGSDSSGSASQPCITVAQALLSQLPSAGSGSPSMLLGMDENGCLRFYSTAQCEDSSSSGSV